MSRLRNRFLVLWPLEILIGQQILYSMGLVTHNERYYHPLNALPELHCIAGFVLNG